MSGDTPKSEQLALPDTEVATGRIDLSRSQPSTVKLDDLGPMLVNTDGTLSRIQNWQSMTALEKERTLKILGKRNMLRQEKLKNEDGDKQ